MATKSQMNHFTRCQRFHSYFPIDFVFCNSCVNALQYSSDSNDHFGRLYQNPSGSLKIVDIKKKKHMSPAIVLPTVIDIDNKSKTEWE